MKNINENVYKEKRIGRGHLVAVAVIVGIIALAMLIGGIALFVRGCIVSGVWPTIWRVTLGGVLGILGAIFGYVAFMMGVTASGMMKVKDGNVSDIGNSGMGTINVVKCDKCGEKLSKDATFCTKCGTELEGVIKCECGTVNDANNEFCKNCGKKLK